MGLFNKKDAKAKAVEAKAKAEEVSKTVQEKAEEVKQDVQEKAEVVKEEVKAKAEEVKSKADEGLGFLQGMIEGGMTQDEAATLIQKLIKGWLIRNRFRKMIATIKIQKNLRMVQAKKMVADMKAEKEEQEGGGETGKKKSRVAAVGGAVAGGARRASGAAAGAVAGGARRASGAAKAVVGAPKAVVSKVSSKVSRSKKETGDAVNQPELSSTKVDLSAVSAAGAADPAQITHRTMAAAPGTGEWVRIDDASVFEAKGIPTSTWTFDISEALASNQSGSLGLALFDDNVVQEIKPEGFVTAQKTKGDEFCPLDFEVGVMIININGVDLTGKKSAAGGFVSTWIKHREAGQTKFTFKYVPAFNLVRSSDNELKGKRLELSKSAGELGEYVVETPRFDYQADQPDSLAS